jgi:hypothetical protein
MENQKIAEEAFQKAFDEALNGPIEEYKCQMGCALYEKDGKCRCWKGTTNPTTTTNYFIWEPTLHNEDQNLPPTQVLLTQEIEMEDFINPADDLKNSEMREIDKQMKKIVEGARKEEEEKKKKERDEKRELEG